MTAMMKSVIFSTALVLGAASAAGAQATQATQPPPAAQELAGLKAGDRAPNFELQGSDGKTYRLSDLKGKAVVLAWFPKAFTGG